MNNTERFSKIELESKLISKKDRYQLSKKEEKEIKNSFLNKDILISGACGSIGNFFVRRIFNFSFKNLYLLDKNENDLVELNRDLSLLNLKKIKKTNFICADITSFNLDNFLLENNIQHYYNFAAIKHVRSEENLDSLKYMFKTNCINFCPKKKNKLKVFFSISSDKAVLPESFLGISKFFMEEKIASFAMKNKSVFVSTVRFANVSFSNGSYLKYAKERIEKKKSFGLPLKIKRYFITHNEAISLCLKSLLKKNKNKIIMPSDKIITKEFKLSSLVKELLKLYGYKIKYSQKILFIRNKLFPVVVYKKNLEGQKNYEVFYDKNKFNVKYDLDNKTMKIDLANQLKIESIVRKLLELKSKQQIINLVKKKVKKFNPLKKTIKVSKII